MYRYLLNKKCLIQLTYTEKNQASKNVVFTSGSIQKVLTDIWKTAQIIYIYIVIQLIKSIPVFFILLYRRLRDKN